jgi:hypothetical protein
MGTSVLTPVFGIIVGVRIGRAGSTAGDGGGDDAGTVVDGCTGAGSGCDDSVSLISFL